MPLYIPQLSNILSRLVRHNILTCTNLVALEIVKFLKFIVNMFEVIFIFKILNYNMHLFKCMNMVLT